MKHSLYQLRCRWTYPFRYENIYAVCILFNPGSGVFLCETELGKIRISSNGFCEGASRIKSIMLTQKSCFSSFICLAYFQCLAFIKK